VKYSGDATGAKRSHLFCRAANCCPFHANGKVIFTSAVNDEIKDNEKEQNQTFYST